MSEERRRATDPAIHELVLKVDKLEFSLRNHIADEEQQLENIAQNKAQVEALHTKMDSMLEIATVWRDVKGTVNVTKWVGGIIILLGSVWAAIDKWIIK